MGEYPGQHSYTLTFDQQDGYLLALVKADTIDGDTALEYLTSVAEKCKEVGCERLMLFRDIPAMLPDGVLFFVTKEFLAMIKGTKVAFINPYAEISTDMRFAITIGNNRGADYDVFADQLAAEKWLLSK